jgi:hypothetical protein
VLATERRTDPNSEQERKKSDLIRLLEKLIDDVHDDRLFGDFSVSFSAQSGKIGHFEEVRRRTFK